MWKVQANDGGQQTNFDQRSYLKLKVLHTYSSHILRNSFLLILLKGNNTSKTEWMLNFVKLSEFWLLSLTKWIKKKKTSESIKNILFPLLHNEITQHVEDIQHITCSSIHSAWYLFQQWFIFSNTGTRCHKPAVSQGSLSKVISTSTGIKKLGITYYFLFK